MSWSWMKGKVYYVGDIACVEHTWYFLRHWAQCGWNRDWGPRGIEGVRKGR